MAPAPRTRDQINADIAAIASGFKHNSTSPEDVRWNAGLRQTIDRLATELDTATA